MPPTKYINASEAYKIMVRMGYSMSYPTAIKWLRDNGLGRQPTGAYGQIQVDEELLRETMTKNSPDPKRKRAKPRKFVDSNRPIRRGRKPNATTGKE